MVRGAGLEPAKASATRCLTRGWDLKSRPFDQPRVPPLMVFGDIVKVYLFRGEWGYFFMVVRDPVCWHWARSAVWIARRPPKPEVVGSNPTGPAIALELILPESSPLNSRHTTSSEFSIQLPKVLTTMLQ